MSIGEVERSEVRIASSNRSDIGLQVAPPATLFAHFFHFASSLPFLHLPSFHFISFLLLSFTSFRLLFSLSICLAFNLLFTLIIHQSQSHSGKIMMNIHKTLTVNTLQDVWIERLCQCICNCKFFCSGRGASSIWNCSTSSLRPIAAGLWIEFSSLALSQYPTLSKQKIMKSQFMKISSV